MHTNPERSASEGGRPPARADSAHVQARPVGPRRHPREGSGRTGQLESGSAQLGALRSRCAQLGAQGNSKRADDQSIGSRSRSMPKACVNTSWQERRRLVSA